MWLYISLLTVSTCLLLACSTGESFRSTQQMGKSSIKFSDGLTHTQRKAFTPMGQLFQPMSKTQANDWLTTHREPGQTYEQFLASKPRKPGGRRRVIYLQPIGELDPKRSPPLKKVAAFVKVYFPGLKIKVAKPIGVDSVTKHSRTRLGSRGQSRRQLFTKQVFYILKQRLPRDAFCVIGVTMEDLFAKANSGFTFGEASLYGRVGVVSFARLHPSLDRENEPSTDREKFPPDAMKTALERSCKILAHETAHTFALRHCIQFNCLMNGYAYMREVDAAPLQLCPFCLRKLHSSVGFDLVARYRNLESWYRGNGFGDDHRWTLARLKHLNTNFKGDRGSGELSPSVENFVPKKRQFPKLRVKKATAPTPPSG